MAKNKTTESKTSGCNYPPPPAPPAPPAPYDIVLPPDCDPPLIANEQWPHARYEKLVTLPEQVQSKDACLSFDKEWRVFIVPKRSPVGPEDQWNTGRFRYSYHRNTWAAHVGMQEPEWRTWYDLWVNPGPNLLSPQIRLTMTWDRIIRHASLQQECRWAIPTADGADKLLDFYVFKQPDVVMNPISNLSEEELKFPYVAFWKMVNNKRQWFLLKNVEADEAETVGKKIHAAGKPKKAKATQPGA